MKKQKSLLLLFIFFVSLLLIVTNFYTIKVLSAARAYINGESEYSKGQKDASLYLVTYVESENIGYWHAFNKSITVPKGDNIARNALLSQQADEIARQGFITGKNHPDDIPDMIWLFKNFHNAPFMKKAIDIWASAEPLINQFDTIGNNVHAQIEAGTLSAEQKTVFTKEINFLSSQLSEKESAFSNALGETARDIKGYLLLVNILLILLLLSTIAVYAVKTINNLIMIEKELIVKNKELNDTNKQLEQFTYAASHDLQEPLRMVSSYMGLLQKKYEGQLDEKAQTYIHFAVDGTKRMKTLINDLLNYSRTSITAIEYHEVNTADVISEIKKLFIEDLNEPTAGIFFNNLPVVRANSIQMSQLFQNLISNAMKYRTEAAPQIHIAATKTATHWIFSVRDNGLGIDEQFFEKIFVIFQRLHSNSTHKGTGIGLAICKKIAERHGGEIWLESQKGKGSTFFFSISKNL
ncbi:sensor histidine kinase [Lacibacter sediminis]|uniref:histidine kinase n=1 Tax=Lacibacter sediminis TaxID=2760713 RepID=A0A7G5XLQ1_9BACT|nr:ATP-binding protein [Lacibacter sediminis]QNA46404.1 GHKL domain-containing protein [Lacibacter sediminis]